MPVVIQAQGVELMCLILSSKRQSRYGALKLLDFCMTSYGQPCEEFVDRGGLKNLFGVFMGKARIKGPQGKHPCSWKNVLQLPCRSKKSPPLKLMLLGLFAN